MKTLIKNALIADGSGSALFPSDVLIDNNIITAIGKIEISENIRQIDATDLILCPGFIDIHAHSDLEILRNPSMNSKISQGITSDLSGNCGVGTFPFSPVLTPAFADILGHYDNWNWTDYSSYRSKIKSKFNIAFLQNHALLRINAIKGNPNRAANTDEVKTMCKLLETSIEQGCLGFSSGLYYAPNIYADPFEITELLKVVKKHNAIFCVHHRCEGDFILSSIDEILSYAQKTDVKIQISHLKAIGIKNQNKVDTVLEKIHKAREIGIDVAFDQYPYEYGSTSLYNLLPPSYLKLSKKDLINALKDACQYSNSRFNLIKQIEHPENWDSVIELCGFDNIKIAVLETNPQYCSLTLPECAELLHCDPYSALFKILIEEQGCALMFDITQSTENLIKIMKDPLMCFGTDALYTGQNAHPRSANATIHILDYFCKRKKIFSWQEMIHKMTGKVAQRIGFKDRGFIKEKMKADLVLFDPKTLQDNSTMQNPFKKSQGIKLVMINGEIIENCL